MEKGKIKDSIYDRSVRRPMEPVLDMGGGLVRDQGSFGLSNMQVCTAQSSVCGGSGHEPALALAQCAGRLAAMGAGIRHADLTLLVSEALPESLLKAAVKELAVLAAALGITIGSCDARGIPSMQGLTAVCMAVGEAESLFVPEEPAQDQDVIMAGYAGLAGSLQIAADREAELEAHFNPAFLEPVLALSGSDFAGTGAAAVAAQAGVRCMLSCGEGGIFTGLWEMAKRSGIGIRADLPSVLLRQETVEICDFYDISPYQLYSGGTLLMCTDHGQKVLDAFRAVHIPAAVIGHMSSDRDRVVLNEDEQRFLEPFRGDSGDKMI